MSDRQSVRQTPPLFVYIMLTLWSGVSFWLIAHFCHWLDISNTDASRAVGSSGMLVPTVSEALRRSLASPIAALVLQILAILMGSRMCAAAMHWLGQPRVIGEVFAGLPLLR